MRVNRDEMVAVALRHAEAEGTFDLPGTLATLEGEPVYELFPVGLRMVGMDKARRYYAHYFAEVAPRIQSWGMVSEWVNETGVLQEYTLTFRHEPGRERTYRILGILTFGETKLSGERIYADETLLQAMFAPLWDEMEPIP